MLLMGELCSLSRPLQAKEVTKVTFSFRIPSWSVKRLVQTRRLKLSSRLSLCIQQALRTTQKNTQNPFSLQSLHSGDKRQKIYNISKIHVCEKILWRKVKQGRITGDVDGSQMKQDEQRRLMEQRDQMLIRLLLTSSVTPFQDP